MEEPETHYTVNFTEGLWFLFSWQGHEQVASAALPENVGGLGFWQVVIEEGTAYSWAGSEHEAFGCAEYIEQHTADSSHAAPPGVAAHPKALPGMQSLLSVAVQPARFSVIERGVVPEQTSPCSRNCQSQSLSNPGQGRGYAACTSCVSSLMSDASLDGRLEGWGR